MNNELTVSQEPHLFVLVRSRPSADPSLVHPLVRGSYLVAGLLLTGIGIAGYVLPVLPGTIFLILALSCFRKSSPPLARWLLSLPKIGPILHRWDTEGSIAPRVKAAIHLLLWLFLLGSCFSVFRHIVEPLLRYGVLAGLIACGLWVSWFINTRPNSAELPSA